MKTQHLEPAMRTTQFFPTLLLLAAIQGCTTGELRAFNDALASQNGQQVYYPDQSDTEFVGDIKWTTGVWDGSGYQIIKNTGDDYCRVRVRLEDGSYEFYNLEPYEGTGDMYTSIYNQPDYMNIICNSTSRVFNTSF
jgi:hypothetical protein